jgi:5-methylcytosine-specific restriction endonuclease McrA
MRFCQKCEKDTPREKHGECKICHAAYRAANRDKRRAYNAANREKARAYNRNLYLQKKPCNKCSTTDRYPSGHCKFCTKAAHAKTMSNNPGLNSLYVKLSRQKNGTKCSPKISGQVTKKAWAEILEYHDHRCAYCLEKSDELTLDHVIAISRGGEHVPENIVPACRACNSKKCDRPIWRMLSS